MDDLSPEILEEIQLALRQGRMIDAIKLYRQETGLGLAEANYAIDRMIARGSDDGAASSSDSARANAARRVGDSGMDGLEAPQRQEILDALFAGRKIGAIKAFRSATGYGLKESKDFIDTLESQLRREMPDRFSTPQGSGCSSAAVVFALVLFSVAWLLRTLA